MVFKQLFNGKLYNAGLYVYIFVVVYRSIHPRFKQDVAHRLVLGARAVAYGEENVSFQGPYPISFQLDQSSLNITFDQEISATHSDNAFEV